VLILKWANPRGVPFLLSAIVPITLFPERNVTNRFFAVELRGKKLPPGHFEEPKTGHFEEYIYSSKRNIVDCAVWALRFINR